MGKRIASTRLTPWLRNPVHSSNPVVRGLAVKPRGYYGSQTYAQGIATKRSQPGQRRARPTTKQYHRRRHRRVRGRHRSALRTVVAIINNDPLPLLQGLTKHRLGGLVENDCGIEKRRDQRNDRRSAKIRRRITVMGTERRCRSIEVIWISRHV